MEHNYYVCCSCISISVSTLGAFVALKNASLFVFAACMHIVHQIFLSLCPFIFTAFVPSICHGWCVCVSVLNSNEERARRVDIINLSHHRNTDPMARNVINRRLISRNSASQKLNHQMFYMELNPLSRASFFPRQPKRFLRFSEPMHASARITSLASGKGLML